MTITEKNILSSFSSLLNAYSPKTKRLIIKHLSDSIKKPNESKEAEFYKTFGGFIEEKTDEEVIEGIKKSRSFRPKKIIL
jgi:hypothetical protein